MQEHWFGTDDRRMAVLPCILVIGEAALEGNLIMPWVFKHLEKHLAAQTVSQSLFLLHWQH